MNETIRQPTPAAIAIAEGVMLKATGFDKATLRVGLDVARNHMQRGAYREAFQTYAMMILCDPSDVDFQIGLANCALYVNENEIALQCASAAIGYAPKDPRGYYLSARACLALGVIPEAREDLAEAINLAIEADDTVVALEARKLLSGLRALDVQH